MCKNETKIVAETNKIRYDKKNRKYHILTRGDNKNETQKYDRSSGNFRGSIVMGMWSSGGFGKDREQCDSFRIILCGGRVGKRGIDGDRRAGEHIRFGRKYIGGIDGIGERGRGGGRT